MPTPEGQAYLYGLDDRLLACKAQSHDWPKLKRPGILPKGLKARRGRDGVVQLEYTCPDCHTVRYTNTAPGGSIEYPRTYTYRYPEGYLAPKGAEITRRDMFDELWRRTAESLPITPEAKFSG